MDKKVISYLLKLVTVFMGAIFLFVGAYLVPAYLRFIEGFAPEIGSVALGAAIYINLSFLPVYVCLALAWRIFSTIAKDGAFCVENVKRLQTASWLALADVGMVAAFFLYLSFAYNHLVSPFFLLSSLCLIFVGFSAAIVCFALAKLVSQAVELKQEVDLTV